MKRRFGDLMSRAPTYKRRFLTESRNEEWEFQKKCMKADNFKDIGAEDIEFLRECRCEIERYRSDLQSRAY